MLPPGNLGTSYLPLLKRCPCLPPTSTSCSAKPRTTPPRATPATRSSPTPPTGADSERTQAILARWHQHLRAFYEPSLETLAGLGHTYEHDPELRASFAAIHPDLPPFIAKAVAAYVAALKTRRLEQELKEE